MDSDLMARLTSIGLTDGEAKTYLALLSTGTSSVGHIIEQSGVSASKVYYILERLMQKGLVTMFVKDSVRHFTAAAPAKLLEYIEEEKGKLDENMHRIKEILPMLKTNYAPELLPIAEVAKGKRGFETIYSEMIESAKPGSTYFGVAGREMSFKLQSFWYTYSLKTSEKNISQRLVYEQQVWNKKDPKVHRRDERKDYYPLVLPAKYKELPNVLVLGNKAILTGVDDTGEPFSLIIRNRHLADALMKLLEVISDSASVPKGFSAFPKGQGT